MKSFVRRLPLLLTLLATFALMLYGPIGQPENYHDFADRRVAFGLANVADVLSNAGFAIVGVWGLVCLWPMRRHPVLAAGWPGYSVFLCALVLTAIGSSFYHLAPDNSRLVWDRLPIALACAGLLAGVRSETQPESNGWAWVAVLSIAAGLSVLWWQITEQRGVGDLRPYLLIQGLPLLLIPLWQAIYPTSHEDRWAFGVAIMFYVTAKAAELYDHELMQAIGWISGHTLKHLLATAGVAVLTRQLVRRVGAVALLSGASSTSVERSRPRKSLFI